LNGSLETQTEAVARLQNFVDDAKSKEADLRKNLQDKESKVADLMKRFEESFGKVDDLQKIGSLSHPRAIICAHA
jgi:hypothetical protein